MFLRKACNRLASFQESTEKELNGIFKGFHFQGEAADREDFTQHCMVCMPSVNEKHWDFWFLLSVEYDKA